MSGPCYYWRLREGGGSAANKTCLRAVCMQCGQSQHVTTCSLDYSSHSPLPFHKNKTPLELNLEINLEQDPAEPTLEPRAQS